MHNKAWWVVIGLNILILPHYFITWHGDVMGIYRHVLTASIQFYLGMLASRVVCSGQCFILQSDTGRFQESTF